MSIPGFALLPYQPDFRRDKAAMEERNGGKSRRGGGRPGAAGAEGPGSPPLPVIRMFVEDAVGKGWGVFLSAG